MSRIAKRSWVVLALIAPLAFAGCGWDWDTFTPREAGALDVDSPDESQTLDVVESDPGTELDTGVDAGVDIPVPVDTNCGMSGQGCCASAPACESGLACVAMMCSACTAGTACGGTCVDIQTDPRNCGRCGMNCTGGTRNCMDRLCVR